MGQPVTVTDHKTGLPVEGVLLVAGDRSMQTGSDGVADIAFFDAQEIIRFLHPSYRVYRASRQQLLTAGCKVRLRESPVRIREIQVSANRYRQTRAEVPQKVSRIGREEMLRQQLPTLADVAGLSADVFVQKSQQGGGSPMIRGFSANRLLLVIDGIRMNNAIYRSGNLQNIVSVDGFSLENMEIIPGPGSVIFGSDALGGVLNMTTLKPRLATGPEAVSESAFTLQAGSASRNKTLHLKYGAGSPTRGWLVTGTWRGFGDLKMGSHGPEAYLRNGYVLRRSFTGKDTVVTNPDPERQVYSGYQQLNLQSKWRYMPSDRLDINAGLLYSRTGEVPRYDRLIVTRNQRLRYGEWYYGPQNWLLGSLTADYSGKQLLFDGFSLVASVQYYGESRYDRNLDDPVLYGRLEKLLIGTVNFDLHKQAAPGLSLDYGLEACRNHLRSSGSGKNLLTGVAETIIPRYPDQSATVSFAGYLSSRYLPLPSLVVQAGLRATAARMSGRFPYPFYRFPFEKFDTRNFAVNGNAGLAYRPSLSWQLNLLASSGFRAPNLDDAGKVFDSEPGNVIVPNPALKPEYALNLEAGIRKQFGSMAALEIDGFVTRLENAMVRRPFTFGGQDSLLYNGILSKVEALVNTGFASIAGTTLEAEYQPAPWLKSRHALTLMRGSDSDGQPLRHAAPLYGYHALLAERKSWTAECNVRYNAKVPYRRLSPEEREKPYLYLPDAEGNPFSPAWFTLNFKVSIQLSPLFALAAGVDNLLDKRYRPYSSGIAAPGRDWSVALSGRF